MVVMIKAKRLSRQQFYLATITFKMKHITMSNLNTCTETLFIEIYCNVIYKLVYNNAEIMLICKRHCQH